MLKSLSVLKSFRCANICASTIFKRFEWLRRNDNRNNLNNHNIKLDINNPILASLKNRLQTSLKDIKYTQASLKKENLRPNYSQKVYNFYKLLGIIKLHNL